MKNVYLFLIVVVALTWGVELRAQGVNGTISTGNLFCIPVISTTSASSIADDSVVIGGEFAIYWPGFAASLAITVFFLWFGIRYFRKTEKTFADVI